MRFKCLMAVASCCVLGGWGLCSSMTQFNQRGACGLWPIDL